jgi:hypothetical protein
MGREGATDQGVRVRFTTCRVFKRTKIYVFVFCIMSYILYRQDSLVDRWLRDQIKPATWDKIDQVFPQQVKCSSQQKWALMTEDTMSLVPIWYQQYDITVKLTPDKHDKTHATFGTLPKTYPTLWVCCAHHDCMAVYDVTSANDTQRNIHLTDHHTFGVKAGHSHQALHRVRLVTLAEKNATAVRRHMSITGLAHLRVARYFIKNMRPFSHCEDASYREQASPDWVACARDTIRGTIGECFLVVAQQVNLVINSAVKCAMLAPRMGSTMSRFLFFYDAVCGVCDTSVYTVGAPS